MNASQAEARSLVRTLLQHIHGDPSVTDFCDLLVCPPFPYLLQVNAELKSEMALGSQDCSIHDNGAYTGDVSAKMLRDIGCSYVILGHSERRQYHMETDALVVKKAERAHAAGLTAIICLGETQTQRERGQEKDVVGSQLADAVPATATAANTVIAYEPVWAIGTGKTATPADVQAMHSFIRGNLNDKKTRILYGGSMKPENSAELLVLPDVDGGLIGGASLKADQFMAIAKSVQKE